MSIRKCFTLMAAMALMLPGLTAAAPEAGDSDACARQFTFSYPFRDGCRMTPRGGVTKGAPVTLDEAPNPGWVARGEPGLSDFERDRRAILAMSGPHRASFDFLETAGFAPGFEPARPYQSWGTEYVYVIEDTGEFISLQHVMVMVFADGEGGMSEPMVMKHWRQDWRYEPDEVLTYDRDNRWSTEDVPEAERAGAWSQTVWQVDDSPRYGSVGRWRHEANFSVWESAVTRRPLPRRESSVRDDYDVLEGINRHLIVPDGWIQEEQNMKLVLNDAGNPDPEAPYLARELGMNRYDRIVGHDFSPADNYWAATKTFWASVRRVFDDAIADDGVIELSPRAGDTPLFVTLFQAAGKIASGEARDDADALASVRALIAPYLVSE